MDHNTGERNVRNAAEKAFDEILDRIIDSRFNMEINWGSEFRALFDIYLCSYE